MRVFLLILAIKFRLFLRGGRSKRTMKQIDLSRLLLMVLSIIFIGLIKVSAHGAHEIMEDLSGHLLRVSVGHVSFILNFDTVFILY